MPEFSVIYYGKTAMFMIDYAVKEHKKMYHDVLPHRVTLSAKWREEMQHATMISIEGQEVNIRYRRNQDKYTVSFDTKN